MNEILKQIVDAMLSPASGIVTPGDQGSAGGNESYFKLIHDDTLGTNERLQAIEGYVKSISEVTTKVLEKDSVKVSIADINFSDWADQIKTGIEFLGANTIGGGGGGGGSSSVYGSAGKDFGSSGNVTENIKKSFDYGRSQAEKTLTIVENIKNNLTNVDTKWAENLKQAVKPEIFDDFSDSMLKAGPNVQVEKLKEALLDYASTLRLSTSHTEELFQSAMAGGKQFETVVDGLNEKIGSIGKKGALEYLDRKFGETSSSAENLLDKIGEAKSHLLAWTGALMGGFHIIDVSLDSIGDSFKTLADASSAMFTQFNRGGELATEVLGNVANVAGRTGQSIQEGAEAFENLRSSGIRSVKEINKTLDTAGSIVLTVGGDLSDWAMTLGEIQYNLQFSSKQVKSITREAALMQKQFSLTEGETKGILENTNEIMSTMFALGNASASAMGHISKALGAAKAFRAGNVLEDAIKGMTSAREFFQSSGENQLLLLKMTTATNMTMQDILSGEMAGTQKGMKAMEQTLRQIHSEASGITDNFARQEYLNMHNISGMKELEQNILAANTASMSFEDQQAKVVEVMDRMRAGGVDEFTARQELKFITGKELEGNLETAAQKWGEVAKLQARASEASKMEDVMSQLGQEIVKMNQGLGGDFQGTLTKLVGENQKLFDGIDLSGSQQEIMKRLGSANERLQSQAETAQKQLERQRAIEDPILALKQAIMGPMNDLFASIASGIYKFVDFIGPTGIEIMGAMLVALVGISATVAAIRVLSAAKDTAVGAINLLKGGAGGLLSKVIGNKSTESVAGGVAGKIKDALPGVNPKGGKALGQWIHGFFHHIGFVKNKDMVQALKIVGVMTTAAAGMAAGIYLLNKATKGMDVVAFLAGVGSYILLMLAVSKMSKVIKEGDLVKSLRPIALMTGVSIALIPMAYALGEAASAMKDVTAGDMAKLGIGILGLAGLTIALTKMPVAGNLAALAQTFLAMGGVLLGIALLGLPMQLINLTYSGIDMGLMAQNMAMLTLTLLAVGASVLAIATIGGAVLGAYPVLLPALGGMAATLVAIAALAIPIYLVQGAYSGIDMGSFALTMGGLAIGLASLGVSVLAIAYIGALAIGALPLIVPGLLAVGAMLLGITALSFALIGVQSALSGFSGVEFGMTMGGLALGMASLYIVGTTLMLMAPLLLMAPAIALGVIAAIPLLGAVSLLAVAMNTTMGALGGFDGAAFGSTMWGIGKGLMGLALVGVGLAALGKIGFFGMASAMTSGLLAIVPLMGAVIVISHIFSAASGSLANFDAEGFGKSMEGIGQGLWALGKTALYLSMMSAGLFLIPGMIFGIGAATLMLGALTLIAPAIRFFSSSFAGVDTKGATEAMTSITTILESVSKSANILDGLTDDMGGFGDGSKLKVFVDGIEAIESSGIMDKVIDMAWAFQGLGPEVVKSTQSGFEALSTILDFISNKSGDLENLTEPSGIIFKGPSMLQTFVAGIAELEKSGIVESIVKIANKFGNLSEGVGEQAASAIGVVNKVISFLGSEGAKNAGDLTAKSWGGFGSSTLDNVAKSIKDINEHPDFLDNVIDMAYRFQGIDKSIIDSAGAAFGLVNSIFSFISKSTGDAKEATKETGWLFKGPSKLNEISSSIREIVDHPDFLDSIIDLAYAFYGLDESTLNNAGLAFQMINSVFGFIRDSSASGGDITKETGLIWKEASQLDQLSKALLGIANSPIPDVMQILAERFSNISQDQASNLRRSFEVLKMVIGDLSELTPLAEKLMDKDYYVGSSPIDKIGEALKKVSESSIMTNLSKISANVGAEVTTNTKHNGTISTQSEVLPVIPSGGSSSTDFKEVLDELRGIRAAVEGMNNNGIKVSVGGTGSERERSPIKTPRKVSTTVGVRE